MRDYSRAGATGARRKLSHRLIFATVRPTIGSWEETMRAYRPLLLAFASVLLGALAADPTAAQTPRRGGVFSYVIVGDPATLDCHQSGSVYVTSAVGPVYSNLIKYDPTNYPTIVGDVAESWTVSPDGLTYTFKLRPNVKFH